MAGLSYFAMRNTKEQDFALLNPVESPEIKVPAVLLKLNARVSKPLEDNWLPQNGSRFNVVLREENSKGGEKIQEEAFMIAAPSTLPAAVEIPIPLKFLSEAAKRPQSRFRLYLEHCFVAYPECKAKIRARVNLAEGFFKNATQGQPIQGPEAVFAYQIARRSPEMQRAECNSENVAAKLKIVASPALLGAVGADPQFLLAVFDDTDATTRVDAAYLGRAVLGTTRFVLGKETEVTVNYPLKNVGFGVHPRLIRCAKGDSDNSCLMKFTSDNLSGHQPYSSSTFAVDLVAQDFVSGRCNISGLTYFAHTFGVGKPDSSLPAEIRDR